MHLKNSKRYALSVGAALISLVILSGCGTSSGAAKSGDLTPQKSLGKMEGSVSILAWPGYVEDGSNDPTVNWVSDFEKQTGCTVTSKTYGTSDEAFSLMKNGGYDVVAASGDLSLRLIASKAVAPVNTTLLKNYAGIYSFLKMKPWNSINGVSYGVPHGYGANVLMYNTTVFPTAPTSWNVVFGKSAAHAGKITAYDSPIYIADAAVYLMAHKPELKITNPYALDDKQLAAAVTLLKAQRVNIGEYWGDYLKATSAFETGNSVAGSSWQVIQNSVTTGNTAVTIPSEGVTGWSDTWMIAANTPHPDCSYAWLDYISSPKANAAATGYFGEAPSNQAACDFRTDCALYHAGDAAYASKIWYWTTPIAKCLDGRKNVTCTDYSAWTQAWAEIKG